MLYTDFCQQFNQSVNQGDVNAAHRALMQELGRILVRDKQDFVDLLNESGYEAELIDSDIDLIDTFSDNVAHSPSLMLGASMLTAAHNKKMSFDGEDEYLDDDLVKDGYRVMQSSFSGQVDEEHSNVVAAILGAAAAGAGLTKSALDRKRERESVGRTLAEQKEASKQQIIQGVLQAKQQQAEEAKLKQQESAKTRRTIYIAGGAVLAITVLAIVIYSIKKRKK